MLTTAAIVLGGGYLGLVGLSRLAYRSLLYPAPRRGLGAAPAGAEIRIVAATDGAQVQSLWFPLPGAPTVVFFHGNGETIADSVWLGRELGRRGLAFVAVEYRGYGTSPSEGPSEPGLYADAEAVIAEVAATGAPMTLWGSSLGSGVAVEMASRGHGERLILSTPYTSIPAVAGRIMPVLPMRLVVGDRFDNLAKAPRISQPTLIVHGDEDELVPYDMGVALAGAIRGAELITIAGGHHNDLFARAREELLEAVVRHVLGR